MIINVIDQQGTHHTLEAEVGWRIMEIIRDWNLNIKAECGGACACATCHVYVDDEWLECLVPANDDEIDMLDSAPAVKSMSRLSCQIIMTEALDGLTVTLAAGSQKD
jgi:ferredoxin, 2Fe-2S